jgi:hypothetical protein
LFDRRSYRSGKGRMIFEEAIGRIREYGSL